MRGGRPLSWVKPLDTRGNLRPDAVGCNRGHFEHWNLTYLAPGLVARRVHKKHVPRRRRLGYRIATQEEARIFSDAAPIDQCAPNSSAVHETENLVLMVAPIEQVLKRRLEMIEQSRSAVEGAASSFLENQGPGESVYSQQRPIRFKTAQHGTTQVERPTFE